VKPIKVDGMMSAFTGYSEEKAEKVGIECNPVLKKIFENIDNLPQILTRIELDVVEILKNHGPLTTKAVRDFYILNYVSKRMTMGSIKKFKIPIPELARAKEKQLKKEKWKLPSYDKIEYILKGLYAIGIVGKRYDPFKKGLHLWFLSLDFLNALKNSQNIQSQKKKEW